MLFRSLNTPLLTFVFGILTRVIIFVSVNCDFSAFICIISHFDPPVPDAFNIPEGAIDPPSRIPDYIPEASDVIPKNMNIRNIDIRNSQDPMFDNLRNKVRYAHCEVTSSHSTYLSFKNRQNFNDYSIKLTEREKHVTNLRCYLNEYYGKDYPVTPQEILAARNARASTILGDLEVVEPIPQNLSRRLYTSGSVY